MPNHIHTYMDKSHKYDRQPSQFISVIYLNAQGEVNNWDVPLDGVALYLMGLHIFEISGLKTF